MEKELTPIAQIFLDTRKKLGLSQKELGERIGISQSNIAQIENGIRKSCPGVHLLKVLKMREEAVENT